MKLMTRTALVSVWLVALSGSVGVQAGELIYTPVNPTFGGNPNNAAGLLANAQAQNKHKAPVANQQTDLERFTDQLQSAILTRLTATAVNTIFDADGKLLPGKTITSGNYTIAITEEGGNLVMVTTDKSTGSTTRVVVGNTETLSTTE